MLSFRLPDRDAVKKFLSREQEQPLTYPNSGMTCDEQPAGYKVDHLRRRLGTGDLCFDCAVAALRSWTMFSQPWVMIETGGQPPEVGQNVAVMVRIGSVWWWNACRVVYLIDEQRPARRIGFAYGTLPSHAERGEERFLVEMDADGTVWYDVFAYSRPRHWLARLGYPVTTAIQRRFATGSADAMEREVGKLREMGERVGGTALK